MPRPPTTNGRATATTVNCRTSVPMRPGSRSWATRPVSGCSASTPTAATSPSRRRAARPQGIPPPRGTGPGAVRRRGDAEQRRDAAEEGHGVRRTRHPAQQDHRRAEAEQDHRRAGREPPRLRLAHVETRLLVTEQEEIDAEVATQHPVDDVEQREHAGKGGQHDRGRGPPTDDQHDRDPDQDHEERRVGPHRGEAGGQLHERRRLDPPARVAPTPRRPPGPRRPSSPPGRGRCAARAARRSRGACPKYVAQSPARTRPARIRLRSRIS